MTVPVNDIRWGIIGCGKVTEVKSGPALQQAPHSRLVAVMRRDAGKARDYAVRHGVPRWYADAAALVADPEVDAVYVATPPSTHKQYALLAIAAGKPVYVEKPMAPDFAECETVMQAADAAGVPVFVAYYRRALPRFARVRELLAAGMIGAPRSVNVMLHAPNHVPGGDPATLPWRVRPEVSGGGLFVDLGSHMLDILDWLFGPIVAASGQASNQLRAYPAEDTVAMAFAFGNGMLGTGLWNFGSHAYLDRVEVIGNAGTLAFATFGDGPIRVENGQGVHEYTVANPEHIQQPLIATVVRELRGERGACPSTAASAARTSWVMDQVLRGRPIMH